LYRILKKGGTCTVQTPFKDGDIYEDLSIRTETGRLKYFGQKDHVRIYSLAGLKERLTNSGFKVEIKTYQESVYNRFGFSVKENVLICKK